MHGGLREEYAARGFKEGDVVGCYLYMPPGGRPLDRTRHDVVKQKNGTFFVEVRAQRHGPPRRPGQG